MTRLKPYPEYKDSGVPWLGEIPTHWGIERAKGLFERMQRSIRPQDEVVTCFRDGMVTLRRNRRVSGFTESLKEIGYQGVRRGDLVIHAMDAFAGAIGVSDSEGKCTPVYSVCQPKRDLDVHYYAHIVREMARTKYIEALARGIRERSSDFRFEMFASQYLPVPSPSEQRAIARFLDYHDRLTRRYIRAQRHLIELLTEQKQALIQQAVTRGLDPHVKLKPSGIEWLGEIPEHWDVRRLKRTATLHRGYDLPDQQRELGSYPVVSSGGIIGSHSRAMVKGPGVVTGRYGSTGAIYFIEPDFWPHNTSLYVSDFNGNFPRFIYYLLHVISINAHSGKSAVPGVDRKDLHEIRVAVPGLEEQKAIATMLDDRFRRLDIAIGQTAQQIDLTREYRTRLTADVVTGRLDVRGVSLEVLLPDLDEAGDLGDLDGMEEDAESDGLDTEEMNDADD